MKALADADVWDPALYLRFAAQRSRPLDDLLHRVHVQLAEAGRTAPQRVLDVGCGTGLGLQRLASAFPAATLHGLDASAAMAEAARDAAPQADVFVADLATWQPEAPYDLIVCNAVLHWLEDQAGALDRLVDWCVPDGCLAVQIPDNRDAAADRAVQDLLRSPAWRDLLGPVPAPARALPLPERLRVLSRRGWAVDAWTTTYHHVLPDAEAVAAWLGGTTLRPHLSRLDAGMRTRLLAEVVDVVRPTLAPVPGGVHFPFQRVFAVASAPPAADVASTPS